MTVALVKRRNLRLSVIRNDIGGPWTRYHAYDMPRRAWQDAPYSEHPFADAP